jgi:hypothetical protein
VFGAGAIEYMATGAFSGIVRLCERPKLICKTRFGGTYLLETHLLDQCTPRFIPVVDGRPLYANRHLKQI